MNINRSRLATPAFDNQYQVDINVENGTGEKRPLVRFISQTLWSWSRDIFLTI